MVLFEMKLIIIFYYCNDMYILQKKEKCVYLSTPENLGARTVLHNELLAGLLVAHQHQPRVVHDARILLVCGGHLNVVCCASCNNSIRAIDIQV